MTTEISDDVVGFPTSALSSDLLATTQAVSLTPVPDPTSTMLMGWHMPIPIIAVLVAGIFALVNSAVSEGLKRLWARGDRMRLLRSEYLHLRAHYQTTLRLWQRGTMNRVRLRQGIYPEDGFLSDDVKGLSSLHQEAVHRALLLKGTVRNSNALIEAKVAALDNDRQGLLIRDMDEVRDRMTADVRRVGQAFADLPPEWAPITPWLWGRQARRQFHLLVAWARSPRP